MKNLKVGMPGFRKILEMTISFEAFEQMTKKDAYQLYKSKCDDYEKLRNCNASSLKAIETH